MSDKYIPEHFTFPSQDGKSTIDACIYYPQDVAHARAIIQIIHGMAEHKGRYRTLAQGLAAHGYIVCAHDHIGHGGSAKSEDYGVMLADDPARILIADTHMMRNEVLSHLEAHLGDKNAAATLPYFILGHSMGSMVLRAYLALYHPEITGAIISGTAQTPAAKAKSAAMLARLARSVKGASASVPLLDKMSVGVFGKAVGEELFSLAWLSYNDNNVDAYEADPACGFNFKTSGYVGLTGLAALLAAEASAKALPKDVPLLFISGMDDPVGDFGQGVRAAAQEALDAGVADVTCTLYDGMRHEILNERQRGLVVRDILTWLSAHIPA